MIAGVVGLGRMGAGIAARLADAGVLGGAWDLRLPEAVPGPVMPVGQMAQVCEVLLFAVPTTADVRAALAGVEVPVGRVVVDLTTSDPLDGAALAADLAAVSVGYLDAAMTGGAQGAAEGTLSLMIGGEAEVLARVRPVLERFASHLFHLGPAGRGQAMKLVHNAILHATYLATCEGLRLAERAGIPAADAAAVLNAGNARSYVSEVRFPRDILKPEPSAKSAVGTLAKDLALMAGMAARMGAPAPYANMTADMLAVACQTGDPARDFGLLFREFDQVAEAAR
jgi:3-hydroxyisobutyrate dehydrogenase